MNGSTGNARHGIAAVARAAGVSTRTLRHYGDIGLLPATDTGPGGLRRYDDTALVRLQRILLLRSLGLGLDDIRRMLDGERDDAAALDTHLTWLEGERTRIGRQIAAVRTTIDRLREGAPMDTDQAFDGFDNEQYKEEVEERWGRSAFERGAVWWDRLGEDGQRAFRDEQRAIAVDAAALAASGDAPDGPAATALALRQLAWLRRSTPDITPYRYGFLADMYVDDERFASVYDQAGAGAARALRDAMRALADRGF